jgi:hypothetical protein
MEVTIDQMIAALNALKEQYGGEVDVTVWQYGGGMDDLCDAVPVFDTELGCGMVVFETTQHESGIRR